MLSFQRYHLLSNLSAQENTEVPAIYAGERKSLRSEKVRSLLSRLGLGDRLQHTPNELSGGQQQRVSIARALMNGGEVILADEPTGALDSRSGEEMMRLLDALHKEGHTIIIATHDRKVAEHAQRIIENAMGINTIDIRPGKGFGDRGSQRVRTLVAADADAIKMLPFVEGVTPTNSTNVSVRSGNQMINVRIMGVGEDYFRVKGYELADGQYWNQQSVKSYAQKAVTDSNTKEALFPDSSALGKVLFLGQLPVRVVGVTQPKESAFGNNDTLNIWLPYSTVSVRITGDTQLSALSVRVDNAVASNAAEQAIIRLLKMRHGTEDFFTINTDTIRKNVEKTTGTLTLLISSIAIISLIVGGIGVMNIMLVSVTERIREIGVRIAVGARQSDILKQFLLEAVFVCLTGGFLGIVLDQLAGFVFSFVGAGFSMVYSLNSIIAAFACSSIIGVAFGFLPARNAARLNPVKALSMD